MKVQDIIKHYGDPKSASKETAMSEGYIRKLLYTGEPIPIARQALIEIITSGELKANRKDLKKAARKYK